MNAKRILCVLAAGTGLAAVLSGSLLMRAQAQKGSTSMPDPRCKITPVQAIKIATGKVAGRPLQANFEFDEGKWLYGVMVVSGTTIKEVEIDPMTGKVGAVETVTPEDEAKEIRDGLTKAIGGKVQTSPKQDEKDEKP